MGVLKALVDGVWRKVGCDAEEIVAPFSVWSYLQVPYSDTSSTYAAVGYDDSAWATGAGTFGGPAVVPITTSWTGATNYLWVRKELPEATNYTIIVMVDDFAEVWFNGTSLGERGFAADGAPFYVPVPSGLIVPGTQTLAIRARDTGGNAQFDAWVTANVPGKLRLWNGAEWLIECCPGDVGHPLKIEDPASPGTWIAVACMRSTGGLFDTAVYDTATYG